MDQQPTAVQTVTTSQPLSSVSDLLKKTWELYQVGVWKFALLNLVPAMGAFLLVIVLAAYGVVFFLIKDGAAAIAVKLIFGLLGVAVVLGLIYLGLAAQVASIILVNNFSKEKKILDLLKEATPLVLGYFVVVFLSAVLVGLGFVALVIPGVILLVFYGNAVWVNVLEGVKGYAALKRSWDLVRGRWLAVFGRYAAIFALYFLLNFFLAWPQAMMAEDSSQYRFYGFIMNIVDIIVSPFIMIYVYHVYKDLVATMNKS